MVNFGRSLQIPSYSLADGGCAVPYITSFYRRFISCFVILSAFLLTACASTEQFPGEAYDPLEPANRAVHALNKGLDTVALRPASQVYGAITPDPVEDMIQNAASNLGEPADALNKILQGDIVAALESVGRFGINSTIGILGFFDPAEQMGLEEKPTDFGETLSKWGVPEGAYVELPVFGPSTVRNATGRVVDFIIDPLGAVVKAPESDYVLGARVLEVVDLRHRYAVAIDPVLYGSADSYIASRNAYLQSRRGALKGPTDETDLEDPFAFE